MKVLNHPDYARRLTGRYLNIFSAIAVVSAVAAAPAGAATTSCGTERARSSGQVFKVMATGVVCATAKRVAGGWFNVRSKGGSARTIFDQKDRRWTCRITERATGTDPGYNPYTSVRCARRTSIVRFKLRS